MNGRMYDPYLQRFLSPDNEIQSPGDAQSYNRYTYCMNNPLMYIDPSGYSWFGDHWVQVADAVLTVGLITAEVVTQQYWAIIPTFNAGLNVWNNSSNIQLHPGNFATYLAIGAGCGYLASIGGGPLVSGLQAGLNDLAGSTLHNHDIFDDMLFSSIISTASLGLGAELNSLGISQPVSYALSSAAGNYFGSSYNYADPKTGNPTFDGSLSWNKILNMTAAGGMAALSTDPEFRPNTSNWSWQIPHGLSTFTIPNTPLISPNLIILYPNISLPNFFPEMPNNPLPPPAQTYNQYNLNKNNNNETINNNESTNLNTSQKKAKILYNVLEINKK